MGPDRTAAPERAHGEARLSIYLDGESEGLVLTCQSSWWSKDGQVREASLSLTGDTDDAYGLIDEASRWIWQRWKRPIQTHTPFD